MTTDPRARQHESNAREWLTASGFWPCVLFGLQPDRCMVLGGDDFVARCDAQMDRWDRGIKAHQPNGYPTAVRGWRERRARWAVQIIEHHDDERWFELDFDASNPGWGAGLALMHGFFDWAWQKIRRHKTDPFRVAKARGWPVIDSGEEAATA